MTTVRDVQNKMQEIEPLRRKMLADSIRLLRKMNRATKKARPR